MNIHLATKEVLQQSVDPLVNFADFDNWTFNSNYHHTNQPDGKIDMIVMIWRVSAHPFPFFDPYMGEASLGGGSYYTVESGTKTIQTGYPGTSGPGSGVTAYYWGERTPKYSYHAVLHEIGHWLLGSGHPYSQGGTDHHLIWGIMTGPGSPLCANTFERERVAWINPNIITGDILNAPLNDYVTTGVAYKYHPSNGATNEYYYFENHQKLDSQYDDATSNSNDKGIFVIHQQAPYGSSNNIRIKTSNGQWNWQNPFSSNCFGGAIVPAFKTTSVNRAGRNNRDELIATVGSNYLFSLINESGVGVCGDWLHGGGLNNSFNLTYNNVFSPYSNPYTHTWSNTQNNFTMEIIAQNGSIVNAKYYLTNPLGGKPSKPQNFAISIYNTGDNAHPKITWDANLESDVTAATQGYLIERKINSGIWTQIATVSGTTTQYIDYGVSYAGSGPNTASYKIRAKDTQGLTSLYTDIKTVQWGDAWKIVSGIKDVITEYKLQQNYPNPFNPTTKIKYSIKQAGLATIKVFDILGNEVAILVNEVKPEGEYETDFNAVNLPSGVYVYFLRVNDFISNQKMILLK